MLLHRQCWWDFDEWYLKWKSEKSYTSIYSAFINFFKMNYWRLAKTWKISHRSIYTSTKLKCYSSDSIDRILTNDSSNERARVVLQLYTALFFEILFFWIFTIFWKFAKTHRSIYSSATSKCYSSDSIDQILMNDSSNE